MYEMKKSIQFLLLLFLLSQISLSAQKNQNYTNIQFVQTWPATFCKFEKCIKKVPTDFILHGLWPANDSGIPLTNCDGPQRDIDYYLNKHRSELQVYWPSIRACVRDMIFWKHEWKDHGLCANYKISAEKYLTSAIDQRKKIDLKLILKESNITPTHDKSYKKKDIENAIKKKIGDDKNIYVSCKPKNETHVDLFEIFICLDVDAKVYISCPLSTNARGCGSRAKQDRVMFPPPPPSFFIESKRGDEFWN